MLDLEGFGRWCVRSRPHSLVISLSFLAFSMFADICHIMPGAIVSSTSFRISGDVMMSQLFSQATQCSLDFLEPVDSAADEKKNWSSPQTLFQCSSPLLMAKPVALSIGRWTAFMLLSNACRSDSKSPISPITVAGAVTYLATASIWETDGSCF